MATQLINQLFERLEGSEDLSYLHGELWQAVPGLWHSILTTLTWGRPGPASSTKLLRGWTQPSGTVLFSRMTDSAVAAMRSQGGSGAGLALTCCPTCRVTKMEAHLFRVTLMRRLQLPLTVRTCRCGLPLDALGHHRAACARGGSGEARVGSGECCSTDLPRRWRSSEPTFCCGTSIWALLVQRPTADGLRLLWMASPSSAVPNWLSTPPWCVRCGGMVGPPPEPLWKMGPE